MSWTWFLIVILFLTLTYANFSDANHHKKLPFAAVVGTVYCDTCFQHEFSTASHFISGASVAVECKDKNLIPRFKEEVKTNEHGEFKVKLPFTVRKHVRKIKGCTFKLMSSSEPHCAVASDSTFSSMSLKTRKQGEHIFSAGLFSFKPMKKPNLCNKKQSVQPLSRTPFSPPKVLRKTKVLKSSSHKSQSNKDLDEDFFVFPPLIPNPFQPPPLIPNPFQPPPLIPNPFQPPSPPLIPNPFQPPSPPPLFPNPFQPPPSPPPLFPNPFQPPPSPTPLIPNPFQPPPTRPPPSIFPPIPPIVIPCLTPPPPPPPPPASIFPPLPPLFPPLFPPPHSPGSPPSSSKNTSP